MGVGVGLMCVCIQWNRIDLIQFYCQDYLYLHRYVGRYVGIAYVYRYSYFLVYESDWVGDDDDGGGGVVGGGGDDGSHCNSSFDTAMNIFF